jgi:probable HAF family extracellular repeat protein
VYRGTLWRCLIARDRRRGGRFPPPASPGAYPPARDRSTGARRSAAAAKPAVTAAIPTWFWRDCMQIRSSVPALVAIGAGLTGPAAAFGQSFELVPLGNLGSSYAAVTCVNDQGEAVGLTAVGDNDHAFYWRNGTMIDLGTLEGGAASRALWINNNGQVVGSSLNASGQERPVLWQRNAQNLWQITDLNTLGGPTAYANKISDNGRIVGMSSRSSGPRHGFLLYNSVFTDLGALAYPANLGTSEALGVNDAGQVVGYAYAPLWGPDHAFYYNGTAAVDITPPGQFSFARGEAINATGMAAGITILPGGGSTGFEAATWTQAGGWHEIGVLTGLSESEAYGINNAGDVVGRSFDLATNVYRGFYFHQGQMRDLNDLVQSTPPIVEALAINTSGWMAANATDDFVAVQAFIVRPVATCYANCDGSTGTPALNVNDFVCFQSRFAAAEPYADCDQSGSLNVNDFVCFQGRFAAGCR